MPGSPYDALLVVSFGGPDGPDDVMPFLANVLRGRSVPPDRVLKVAEHYYQHGGASPINAQNRSLIAALGNLMRIRGPNLPVYWGNRNWHPLLVETLCRMRDDGVGRALAFVTSPFGSYSSCRQYRENIEAARQAIGPGAPRVDKLRVFFNHPGYLEPVAELAGRELARVPLSRRQDAALVFTAHSIPKAMAINCRYEAQLREASGLAAERLGRTNWTLAFQSRSGPPSQPWLEPDIGEVLDSLALGQVFDVVVVPIGFISDHMEVLHDLDTETAARAKSLGINFHRAATVGTHPRFVEMIRELILERMDPTASRSALGTTGPSHDVCPVDCCPSGAMPGADITPSPEAAT